MFESVMSVLSVFVRVTLNGALVVPTGTLLNESEVGENRTVPVVPCPVSGTVCVPFGASSTIFSVFVRVP